MRTSKSVALCRLLRARGRCTGAAVMLAAALASAQALAGAKVDGYPASITVDAQNIPVAEILAALGHDFNVHYRSSVALNRQITGTYEGSVQRVVTRILQGYNFVVESTPGRIEVMVFGTQNAPMQRAAPRPANRGPIRRVLPRIPGAPALPRADAATAGPFKLQLSDVASPARPFPTPAAANAAVPPSPAGSRHLSIQYGGDADGEGSGHP